MFSGHMEHLSSMLVSFFLCRNYSKSNCSLRSVSSNSTLYTQVQSLLFVETKNAK
ncbi:hypothetical protein EXN66_Car002719 [Channa argus]|uniref:Uncharacterized protein n=1 Tax=Channa argus TaxID=215402 RepID=A0A6G1P9X1_CHAAH|nr:hypothetical protein EXN66_Car002719 [Channa argus]